MTTVAPPGGDETRPASQPGAFLSNQNGTVRAFVPGSVIAKRYRIVALLGRGGMGAVYRADDLKLGQPVALKFLPDEFGADHDAQARLLQEVRIARDVSHPNVCRVYDLVEADGQQFIAMEYVDDEDLASLLRRIGRLPVDKAADIARQLCAGLAAVHDRGLLHRDLKPANVMLDGRGRVRVTDFGLAIDAAAGVDRREIAGTPAYMAPEQLEGRSLSRQTDLYALGLILFELLTGRRFFEKHGASLPSDRSDIDGVRRHASEATLDPIVERLVVRCLEPDPARRPESALHVAASLPGGNPLAAALAAGETPSPALVAAAGEGPMLSPRLALAALIGVLALIGPLAWWNAHDSAFARIQPPFPPDVLEFKVREMLKRLGYDELEMRAASSFEVAREYAEAEHRRFPVSERWKTLATRVPSPVSFWTRLSPQALIPRQIGADRVTLADPAFVVPGMKTVVVDTRGHLIGLWVQPRPDEDTNSAGPIAWSALFAEAGLDLTSFKDAPPMTLPPAWGDARAAWVSVGGPGTPAGVFVEAASYRGRPILFTVAAAAPATGVPAAPAAIETAAIVGGLLVTLTVLALTLTILHWARSNLRAGRADRGGALRIAAFFFGSHLVVRMFSLASPLHVLSNYALNAAASSLGIALLIWILYVALEPQVRRVWPEALIGWNRLLEGRVLDARVGGDVLGGIALSAAIAALKFLIELVSPAQGPPGGLDTLRWVATMSTRHAAASTLSVVMEGFLVSLVILMMLSLAALAGRRRWRTMAGFALLFTLLGGVMGWDVGGSPRHVIMYALRTGIDAAAVLFVVSRLGILSLVSYQTATLLLSNVHTLRSSAWYFTPSLIPLVIVISAAYYGYRQIVRTAPSIRSGLR